MTRFAQVLACVGSHAICPMGCYAYVNVMEVGDASCGCCDVAQLVFGIFRLEGCFQVFSVRLTRYSPVRVVMGPYFIWVAQQSASVAKYFGCRGIPCGGRLVA